MFKHVLQEVEKLELEKYIARDIMDKFEFHNYGHALEILHNAFPTEWGELQECLRRLHLTLADIKKAGGNESPYLRNLTIFYMHLAGEKYASVVI